MSNRQPDGSYPALISAVGEAGVYFGVSSSAQTAGPVTSTVCLGYFESIQGNKSQQPAPAPLDRWSTYSSGSVGLLPWTTTYGSLAATGVPTVGPGKTDAGKTITVGRLVAPVTITPGTYKLQSQVASDRYLDVYNNDTSNGTKVWTCSGNTTGAQRFRIDPTSDGFYTLRNVYSGKYLDVRNASTANGTKVQMWEGAGSCAQKWSAFRYGNGIGFASACSGRVLDVQNASTALGAGIQIYQEDGSAAQMWNLVAQSVTVPTGDVVLRSQATSEYVRVDPLQMSTTSAGRFTIEQTSDGYYTLKNSTFGYLHGFTNGTVGTSGYNTTCDAKWTILTDGSTYLFASACTNAAKLGHFLGEPKWLLTCEDAYGRRG